MTGFVIRPATAFDIAAITTIYAHAVANGKASFELEPPDEREMARRQLTLQDSGYPYLVAERDGSVPGYAYAGPYRARPAYRHTVENSVYVAPDAQQQGVGRRLLSALIVECEALGFRQMIAVIGGSDHAASIRLHERHGFVLIGTLKDVGHKHGSWLDSVLMQRGLGPGSAEPPSR